jgi:hypothetical protein
MTMVYYRECNGDDYTTVDGILESMEVIKKDVLNKDNCNR